MQTKCPKMNVYENKEKFNKIIYYISKMDLHSSLAPKFRILFNIQTTHSTQFTSANGNGFIFSDRCFSFFLCLLLLCLGMSFQKMSMHKDNNECAGLIHHPATYSIKKPFSINKIWGYIN